MSPAPRKRVDFDRARAERRAKTEPIVLTAFEKEYEIPGSPPMGFVAMLARFEEDEILGPKQIDELLVLALGKDAVKGLYESGLELDDLEDLLRLIAGQWSSSEGGGGSAGEAPAPDEGASSS